ncbi:pyridoxamine 5'-phosphate oxidase [Rhodospirillum rubrum]|uniref:pyridoxamine 5'-phosphate oxidase family protein n=1 Tax=Rhodospirillum rubrum TaxID=1085 RepID=UPI00190760B3|nr:pyridoxamine 5'-phosphate oxidase family protein [Rhodospirillum rubrum]MBK1665791.1 pyridoxamine 5'-phosphate oxidase [Rhodospirillum rubrum]MBK1677976.1 pyridoxamine 5'-phosphate oxidase [Rhodospirillum rubrum]
MTDPSPRVQLRRHPERGSHQREAILAVLDGAFVCHLAFATKSGPACVPTCYGRIDDVLYIHGAPASRLMAGGRQGDLAVCLTVTQIDGVVMARSAFHHSLNFRSVMVLGTAQAVSDPEEKTRGLAAITDQVAPGRWDECRPMTEAELKATAVLRLDLAEASLKERQGPPSDPASDAGLPIWTGVVPLALSAGAPLAAEDAAAALPDSVKRLRARHPAP